VIALLRGVTGAGISAEVTGQPYLQYYKKMNAKALFEALYDVRACESR
jgi:hypothetical protein